MTSSDKAETIVAVTAILSVTVIIVALVIGVAVSEHRPAPTTQTTEAK